MLSIIISRDNCEAIFIESTVTTSFSASNKQIEKDTYIQFIIVSREDNKWRT